MNRAFTSFGPLLAAVALGAATPAVAQPDYSRSGVYFGLGGTVGVYTSAEDQIERELAALGYFVNVDVDVPLGLNTRVGYRVLPWLAAEGEFEWLSEADVNVSGFGSLATLESWILTANAKAYPITGRFQPFGLLGIGYMNAELSALGFSQDEGGFAARFGGGVDYYITPNIVGSLDVSYVLPTGNIEDIDFVSIGWGFAYRF